MGKIKDLEKERAKFAYEKVEEAIDKLSEKEQKEYKSYSKKIPSMIQTNGLSATLAFMFSKGKTYRYIYKQIDEWLQKRKLKNDGELVKWCIELDSSKHRKVTIEVIALFMWLRRFAEGMIKDSKDGEEKKEK